MCDSYDCLIPPLVSPTNPVIRYREEPPACNPCLPACPRPRCYEYETAHDCDYPYCHAHCHHERPREHHHCHHSPPRYHSPDHHHHSDHHGHHHRGEPHEYPPACRPVRTKYVIPCYRYEDGRIERFVPTRHGTLPKSVYARNGMQDQIHGYRGAQRYVCACETPDGVFVNTLVEPIRKLFPRITEEVWPGKRKKPLKAI